MIMQQLDLNSMPEMATEPGDSSLFTLGRHRAFLKIQDGCRYRCTFCIVTVARGDERSRSIRDLVDETNRVHASGINEIVLTGVHVGGYGSDMDVSLKELVQALLNDTDIPRIRFASVEPWDLPEGFFGLFQNPRLMPHMHLPLQSGSDAILRKMARRCKTDEFRRLVQQARSEVPGFNVTSDVIVGFPGETEQEWANTMTFVEEIGFGHLHIFSYSPREGTKAAGLPNQVPAPVKKQRSRELHRLADNLKRKALQEQLGSSTQALWEHVYSDESGKTLVDGYTRNYFRVKAEVDPKQDWEHRISDIRISDTCSDSLTGRLIE
jgi:threonylcarbamoyladenosine tRNA methylthiotransferase MtaB